MFSVGHLRRCRWSIDGRGAQGIAYQRNNPRLVETVGAGTCSHLASADNSGGVSSVKSASDLDVHSWCQQSTLAIGVK
ncbi:MAG: hypothetical protein WBI13_09205, partial [Synechococcus sp.]